MQINLSCKPVIIGGPNVPSAFMRTLVTAQEYAGALLPSLANDTPEALEKCLDELFAITRPASRDNRSAGAAAAILSLAYEGVVMLPVEAPPLRRMAPSDYPFAMPTLFSAVDTYVSSQRPRWLLQDSHLHLLLATDCRDAAHFDIYAFERLHTWQNESAPNDVKFSLSAPAHTLLRGIELAEGSSLDRGLRHGYAMWRASESDKLMGFAGFMSDPTNLKGMRVHGHERERIELRHHVDSRRTRENQRAEKVRKERPFTPFVQSLLDIAEADKPDAPEAYFAALTGGSNTKGFRPELWIDTPVNYPGRRNIDVGQLGEKWFIAFRAFLAHRQRDYETDKQVRSTLHVFADYLFLYLPWWMQKHPETSISFPSAPKAFLRYFFVDRTRFHTDEEQALGALPKTFNDLLHLRRPTPDPRNTTRIILQKFFNFVTTYFEENADFVTPGMQNPVRSDFDNEVSTSRRGKTNKVPFAEDVFPFLIHYGQAVEAFGEFLQQQAYERNIFRELPNGPAKDGYDTASWGYVPIFRYRGRLYRVTWLPGIYLVAKRTLKGNPEDSAGIYVNGVKVNTGKHRNVTVGFPHLATVRLLMAMTETGLRGQSIQWLDRRTFDSLGAPIDSLSNLYGNPLGQTYGSLYINTDKAHEPWNNLVSWRVRRSMLSERHFQDSVVDSYTAREVRYEDRDNTRFLPVLPLFRSDRGAKPVSDSNYTQRWVEFLYGFQSFYNIRDGVDRSNDIDALVLLIEREGGENGGSYSDRYTAIHTPHACRATYATLRDGDLEVSEIADQLGHSNTTVTNHYQVPQMKPLVAKLKDIDDRMLSADVYDPTGNASAYLHPENEDSSVRLAFKKSPEQAISDFGFVPGVALWSLSELDGDTSTLELLRQSPASAIRWHPTHVCPVGNQCPKEVVANAGGMNRCGICPLAAKCIDHLTGIEAKQTELHERIRTAGVRQRLLSERGAAQGDIDAPHREMQLDTKELLGWKLSAEILRSRQLDLGSAGAGYHVDKPELVRKQLQLVTRNGSESEFFLQRIADSNAYPSLESAEVRAKATRYTRLILARQGRLEDAAFLDVPAHTELSVFASFIRPYVEAKNLTLADLAMAIDSLPGAAALSSPGDLPLLAGGLYGRPKR